MLRFSKILTLLTLVFFLTQLAVAGFAIPKCDQLYQKAQEFENKAYYEKAYESYEKAKKEFLKIGDSISANECRVKMHRIQKIFIDYHHTEKDIKKLLKKNFGYISEKERNAWIKEGKIDFIISDGVPYYYQDFVGNLKYRNLDLARKDLKMIEREKSFYIQTKNFVFKYPDTGYPPKAWNPYIDPITFLVTGSLSVPRKELPKTGLLQLWIPLPILTAAQTNVKVISITPEEYIKTPPKTDGDIGFAYLEIPLEKLKKDLNIKLQVVYSRYQQQFIVDPKNVGEYDKESDLYKKYTASYGNTTITPEIKEKALEIVGDEKNPYLAAKKIYDYVVDGVHYSHMPHLSLNVRGIPESVYVHENLWGDCGAQGIYFSALCRACGIPARTTGGYQLLPGKEGTHFWAEFYLPNYGWLPIDTSIAQTVNYVPELTKTQRQRFKDYYFGCQDPYRFVIQKDVDVPLVPAPSEPILLGMAIQYPAAVCKTMEGMPALTIIKHWKFEFKPVYH